MLELLLTEETVFIDPSMVCGYTVNSLGQLTAVLMKWGDWQPITDTEHNRDIIQKWVKKRDHFKV